MERGVPVLRLLRLLRLLLHMRAPALIVLRASTVVLWRVHWRACASHGQPAHTQQQEEYQILTSASHVVLVRGARKLAMARTINAQRVAFASTPTKLGCLRSLLAHIVVLACTTHLKAYRTGTPAPGVYQARDMDQCRGYDSRRNMRALCPVKVEFDGCCCILRCLCCRQVLSSVGSLNGERASTMPTRHLLRNVRNFRCQPAYLVPTWSLE